MNQVKALYASEKKSQTPLAIKWRTKNEGVMNATVEFRVRSGQNPMLAGHAAVFDQLSEELGFFESFREIIKPGAFSETLKTADVRALWNHDPNFPLGRVRAKTLRLAEDAVGLAVEIDMPDTDYARNIMALVERGDVNQMSFAFSVPDGGDDWKRSDEGLVREVKAVNLFDVSPVTFPAYTQTDLGVRKEIRSIADQLFNIKEPLSDEDAQSIARDLRYDSWEECISDQKKKGYSDESADKICGMIKAEYGGASFKPANLSVHDIILGARKQFTNEEEKEMKDAAARSERRRAILDGRSLPSESKSNVLSYREIIKQAREN